MFKQEVNCLTEYDVRFLKMLAYSHLFINPTDMDQDFQ